MNHTPEPAFRSLDHISSNAQDTSKLAALSARIADLEAQLYAVGAGGVGQSIKPQILADTAQAPEVRIRTSVPTGWKLVPVEPTDDMFIEGMEADCRGRPSIDDDNHVRSIWRAMLSSAPDAPPPPAPQQKPVAWIDVKPNPFDPLCRGAASVQDHALPPGEHKLYAAPQPPVQQEPVAWRVRPFNYGIGHEGVDALTTRKEQCEMWERKGWKVEPLYAAPQPTENLRCKSTQKRLATLWGYVKKEPDHFRDATQMVSARQPLTNEQIIAIADNARAAESGDAGYILPIAFARAIEAAHGITGGQQ